uniref:Uncharacterized protein n=1 Tax=Arundo donax TaxID=35708 RepID=A0A0A9DQR6_ARUDO
MRIQSFLSGERSNWSQPEPMVGLYRLLMHRSIELK